MGNSCCTGSRDPNTLPSYNTLPSLKHNSLIQKLQNESQQENIEHLQTLVVSETEKKENCFQNDLDFELLVKDTQQQQIFKETRSYKYLEVVSLDSDQSFQNSRVMKKQISLNYNECQNDQNDKIVRKKKRIVEKEICSGSIRKFDNVKNKAKPALEQKVNQKEDDQKSAKSQKSDLEIQIQKKMKNLVQNINLDYNSQLMCNQQQNKSMLSSYKSSAIIKPSKQNFSGKKDNLMNENKLNESISRLKMQLQKTSYDNDFKLKKNKKQKLRQKSTSSDFQSLEARSQSSFSSQEKYRPKQIQSSKKQGYHDLNFDSDEDLQFAENKLEQSLKNYFKQSKNMNQSVVVDHRNKIKYDDSEISKNSHQNYRNIFQNKNFQTKISQKKQNEFKPQKSQSNKKYMNQDLCQEIDLETNDFRKQKSKKEENKSFYRKEDYYSFQTDAMNQIELEKKLALMRIKNPGIYVSTYVSPVKSSAK